MISGEVIDWKTGQPADNVELREDEVNFSSFVARTDALGRFTFQPHNTPRAYFLFAGAPRYGKLLQTTFGRTIVVYRKGQRIHNVSVPAIRNTELSGHVYGDGGKPIAGCDVSALTYAVKLDPSTNLQLQGAISMQPSGFAEAGDSKFMQVGSAQTDLGGMFVFNGLGVDRYIVMARCRNVHPSAVTDRFSWAPTLYPDANSISNAGEVILLPGDRRTDIDFHLKRQRTYSLAGKIVFSDHSAPKLGALYFQDMRVLRSDRALTSEWLDQEECQINANNGTFRCDYLAAGEYNFYFEVSAESGGVGNLPLQVARVRLSIPAPANRPPVVQLLAIPSRGVRFVTPYGGPGLDLDFGKVCATAPDGRPAILVRAWGRGRAGGACYLMTFSRSGTRLRLPKDRYEVTAFEAAFVSRERSYLGDSSKFEAALVNHGTTMNLEPGQTLQPSLHVLTTNELIRIALSSVQRRTDDPSVHEQPMSLKHTR